MMPYFYYGYDSVLIIALLGVMVLGFIAQASVNTTFKKYSAVRSQSGMSAANVAQKLLQNAGSSVQITRVGGALTDHFDPKNNIVGLSEAVYSSDSVAALAVGAHEIGHVMQYEEGYAPIRMRNAILPIAQFGSSAAPFIVIGGMLFGSYDLAMIGVILFAAVFAFQMITLPVELNASSRAIEMLSAGGFLSYDETAGAKKVLRAASMTYVVATLSAALTLLRLLLIARGSRRR
ncbi:MAG: putative neutral zinc metallopeptidase [Firmicutes bacterium ADurb.Bin182]|nr:MAG: putative neutral zinc metallopeptidase [Firmicutes bacterium ADurb.Bin182]